MSHHPHSIPHHTNSRTQPILLWILGQPPRSDLLHGRHDRLECNQQHLGRGGPRRRLGRKMPNLGRGHHHLRSRVDNLRTGYHLDPTPRQRPLDPAPGRLVRRRRHRRKTLHRSRGERVQHARGPRRSRPVLHGSHLLVLHLVGKLCRGLQRAHAAEHAAVVDLRRHIRGHLLAVGSRAEPGGGAIYRYYCRGSRVEVRVSGSRRGRALEGGAGACWRVRQVLDGFGSAECCPGIYPFSLRICEHR